MGILILTGQMRKLRHREPVPGKKLRKEPKHCYSVTMLVPVPEWTTATLSPVVPRIPSPAPASHFSSCLEPQHPALLTMSISLVRELTRSETEERGSVRRSDSSWGVWPGTGAVFTAFPPAGNLEAGGVQMSAGREVGWAGHLGRDGSGTSSETQVATTSCRPAGATLWSQGGLVFPQTVPGAHLPHLSAIQVDCLVGTPIPPGPQEAPHHPVTACMVVSERAPGSPHHSNLAGEAPRHVQVTPCVITLCRHARRVISQR